MKKKYLMRINFYYWIIENEKQNMKRYGGWALQQTLKQPKCYMSICDLKAGSIFFCRIYPLFFRDYSF